MITLEKRKGVTFIMAWKKTDNAKPTITLTIDEELLKQLEDYQFDNRIKNRSQAIDELLRKALKLDDQNK
jgi:metal-responsive CopG/Arc/MetJ family transcriptional regulator